MEDSLFLKLVNKTPIYLLTAWARVPLRMSFIRSRSNFPASPPTSLYNLFKHTYNNDMPYYRTPLYHKR